MKYARKWELRSASQETNAAYCVCELMCHILSQVFFFSNFVTLTQLRPLSVYDGESYSLIAPDLHHDFDTTN